MPKQGDAATGRTRVSGPRFSRAVVTGGAGFLGSHLCEQLLVQGTQVVCVDNFLTGRAENVAALRGPTFELRVCDVSVHLDIEGDVDLVLHFASPASPIDYLRYPLETLRVGSRGTDNALELAQRKGARFVLASTSEVYGDPLLHPQSENYWGNVNPVGPRGVYDEAKRFAEAITTAYRNTGSTNTGIVRIFNTYGPGMRPDDGRAIPTFIRQALLGEPLTVAGDGTQTRSFSHVFDVIRGILLLAHTSEPGPVNIGNPQELSVLELANIVRSVVGSDSPIKYIQRPVDDPRIRQPDITAARRLFDWTPTVELEIGLAETAQYMAQELARDSREKYGHRNQNPSQGPGRVVF